MQSTLPPAVHVPERHESFRSHASPSLHAVPSAAFGFEHWPVAGLHVPATWQESDATHVTVLPAVHAPVLQVSLESQRSPSLQAVPSAAFGLEHWPVEALQVPAAWHWSDAVHVTGFVPAHTPLSHESVWVQALASLQLVPSLAAGFEHCPVELLHVPAT